MSTGAESAGRVRRWLRLGLASLAAEMLLLGLPASAASAWFFDWFPFGRGWIAATGPYHEHVIADLGYAYVGLGAVLVWAAVRPGRELGRAAAAGAAVANVPHLIFHLRHAGDLPTGEAAAENALLALAVVVSVGVLLSAGKLSPTGE
ncbi:hypothetical protein ABZ570_08835 [Micromonospora sp. NPDC007271]|uniref:hypothetical protein n=1 Tax=Micromonospora sp. NPDC007271 TaxID=3154587 RepID=UPI0033C53251